MAAQEIKVNINGDTSGLDSALSKGQANLARFAKVGAAAIAATGVAMIGLTKTSLANIDTLTKQARSLGLTTAAFQKMTLVAGEAGIESGKLSSMLGLMQRNIVELQKGTKLQTEAFSKLGLSVKDLQGLSPDEQFAKIAESLDAIKDPAEKTALAMETFGRSGKDAINMLSDYSAKAANAARFQEEFGIAVSQFDSEQIEAANDAMGRLGMIVTGVGNIIAANVAPALVALSNGFIELVGEGSRFREVMGFIGENLDVMANSVGVLAVAMTAKAVPAIYAMVTGTGFLTGAMVALRGAILLTGIGALVISAGYLITKFMDLVENVGGFGNALTLMGGVAKAVFSGIGTSASALVPAMGAVWSTIATGFYTMIEGIQKVWVSFLRNVSQGLANIPGMGDAADAIGGFAIEAGSAVYEYGAAANEAVATTKALNDEAKALASGGVDEAAAAFTRLSDAISGRTGMTFGGSGLGEGSLLPPAAGDAPAGEGEGDAPIVAGGGGGGAVKGASGIASDMAARLEALQEGFATEAEVVAEWYAQGQETLAGALEAELLTREEYAAAVENLERQHQDKLSQIKSGSMSQQLSDAAGFFGSMANVVKTGGEKALKASQILSAAQGLINSYVAFTEVLKDPSFIGRPWARLAAAGGVLAAGLNMVQAIKGVSSSGGAAASSGGGGATATAAVAPAQQPATTFSFTLQNDPMGFGENFARQLIDQLNSTQRNGGQIRGVLA
jgi:hypothetical protein